MKKLTVKNINVEQEGKIVRYKGTYYVIQNVSEKRLWIQELDNLNYELIEIDLETDESKIFLLNAIDVKAYIIDLLYE